MLDTWQTDWGSPSLSYQESTAILSALSSAPYGLARRVASTCCTLQFGRSNDLKICRSAWNSCILRIRHLRILDSLKAYSGRKKCSFSTGWCSLFESSFWAEIWTQIVFWPSDGVLRSHLLPLSIFQASLFSTIIWSILHGFWDNSKLRFAWSLLKKPQLRHTLTDRSSLGKNHKYQRPAR